MDCEQCDGTGWLPFEEMEARVLTGSGSAGSSKDGEAVIAIEGEVRMRSRCPACWKPRDSVFSKGR